ncbi:glycoside hydrolase family 13 protein [Streptomyces sp. A7024]|uniref:Glycoside hydrolase family 13 protein n=1 Tax=Streptomyces coryli TaxID=1128680 RepID=A0A6G4UEN8_9ACTN|nr:glycoside hydrolase family 13 protein [Streptomyces coryli]NGN70027.1 glycoside hydrolase family 13 protein [Streptomyces coryli]
MTQQETPSAPTAAPAGRAGRAGRPNRAAAGWWRDAVIYQIYVRSFADSDGDGNGDLAGARTRLPYLAGLGVDAVWLTPFYASPQADGGYDVADYRTVDPMYGVLADAEEFIREAHRLGLRVIVDIVPNHTSDRHPWFQQALAGGSGRERYHFRPPSPEPPNDWESVFGGPAWTRTPDGSWYLHLFAPEQPDLNWEHPEVRAEFEDILRFWLDRGVDGFRIDVAHGMVKAPGMPDIGHGEQAKLIGKQILPFFDQDGVHDIHRAWRKLLDSYDTDGNGDRIGVAEAWAPTPERLALYVRPDELHQAFNFHFLACAWDAGELREAIDQSADALGAVGAPATWVLGNHDVVRPRTRYGSLARARAAALLSLALPGAAYVYQGEELGLPEVTDLPDAARQDPAFQRTAGQDGLRDGCRVPLPWSGDAAPYGFGADGSWLPQPADWGGLTVAAQEGDPGSTLALYRAALKLRRGLDGPLAWEESPEGVLAFRRGDGFRCIVNTGAREVGVPVAGGTRLLLGSGPVAAPVEGVLRVPADTCVWWGTHVPSP